MPGKATAPPMVADPEALLTAERAAASVGLSVEQLSDLLVDSGIVHLPAGDGISKRYTLEQLGEKMWADMQKQPVSKRAEWFDKLSRPQRVATIVKLRNHGFAAETIGDELGYSPQEVRKVYNAYASELGAQVVQVRLDTIAGHIQLVSEKAQEMATKKGDHNALWRIEDSKVKLFQALGITEQAAKRIEVSHSFDDRARAEIDALVDVERKRAQRREEMKMIEAEVVDEVPAIEDDGS